MHIFLTCILLLLAAFILGLFKPIKTGWNSRKSIIFTVITIFFIICSFEVYFISQHAEKKMTDSLESMSTIKNEIITKTSVKVRPDYSVWDNQNNTKTDIVVKNNSDYVIKKGTVTVQGKDEAGNTIDSGTLNFTKPIAPHKVVSETLWLKTKKISDYTSTIIIDEYLKP